MGHEGVERQCGGRPDQHPGHRRHQGPVREPGADEVARGEPDAENPQHDRHQCRRRFGREEQGVRQIGVDGEHAAKADGANAQHQPDLAPLEHGQLGQRACGILLCQPLQGHQAEDQQRGR